MVDFVFLWAQGIVPCVCSFTIHQDAFGEDVNVVGRRLGKMKDEMQGAMGR